MRAWRFRAGLLCHVADVLGDGTSHENGGRGADPDQHQGQHSGGRTPAEGFDEGTRQRKKDGPGQATDDCERGEAARPPGRPEPLLDGDEGRLIERHGTGGSDQHPEGQEHLPRGGGDR